MLDEAGRLQHLVDLLVQGERGRVAGEALDERHEAVHRRRGLGAERAAANAGGGRLPQGAAGTARCLAQRIETLRTHAACRQVDDALEGGIVAAVGDEPQVRERVLDLGTLEEAQAAINAVRHARGEERLLEDA